MAIGDSSAIRRYSHALFNVAQQRNEIDSVAADLKAITQTMLDSPAIMQMLHNPQVTHDRRKALLQQIFAGNIRPDVEHFLFLLIDKDRAHILPDVSRDFNRFVDEYRGEADAEAVSAVPLTEAQKAALIERLKSSTGLKTIRLTTRVDPNILGGLIIRVGDKLIDGSATTQLAQMKEQLKRAKVI